MKRFLFRFPSALGLLLRQETLTKSGGDRLSGNNRAAAARTTRRKT